MTHTPTLKPCPNPWCEADEREGDFSPVVRPTSFGNWQVCCTSCQQKGPVTTNEPHAITAWNTRTVEAGGVQELAQLLADCLVMLARLKKHARIDDNAGYGPDGRMLVLSEIEENARAALSKWEASK